MEKKRYQTPVTENIHTELSCHLLGVSIDKGEGPGTGTVEIESKVNDWDDWDDWNAIEEPDELANSWHD